MSFVQMMCVITAVAVATVLLLNAERVRAQIRQFQLPATRSVNLPSMDQLKIAEVVSEFLAVQGCPPQTILP
jgi:hypothetical protein